MKRAAASSILVAVMLLAVAVIAEAQQPASVPRIGLLSPFSAPDAAVLSIERSCKVSAISGCDCGQEHQH